MNIGRSCLQALCGCLKFNDLIFVAGPDNYLAFAIKQMSLPGAIGTLIRLMTGGGPITHPHDLSSTPCRKPVEDVRLGDFPTLPLPYTVRYDRGCPPIPCK